MFFVKKKSPTTSSDQTIEQIKNILFPPLRLEEEQGVKFHIDYSADSNLDAALSDLIDGYNDEATRKTLGDVSNRLYKIRQLLEAHMELDSDAKYIVVENLAEDPNIEAKD